LQGRPVKHKNEENDMMKKVDLDPERNFHPDHMKKFLVHDSAYFRIINFNLGAGVSPSWSLKERVNSLAGIILPFLLKQVIS
jgi:hypothetical protein